MADVPQQPLKTIFPDSSFAKRAAIKALRLYAKTLPKPPPFPPPGDAPVKILIQSMGGIGNTLMATPLITATRDLYPNATIDLLTSPGAAQLLQSDPRLNTVIADPNKEMNYWKLVQCLYRSHYDAAICTLNAHLSKHTSRVVLARIPHRIMHEYAFKPYDDFSKAFTNVITRDMRSHDSQENLQLLQALCGVELKRYPMKIYLNDDSVNRAEKILGSQHRDRKIVGFCPGSSGWMSFKRWPIDKCIEFVEASTYKTNDLDFLVFIGPDESEDLEIWNEVKKKTPLRVIYGLDIKTYAAVVAKCDVIVSNDSLPMHLCSCTNTPVVALFGPTDAARTGPWLTDMRVVNATADYAPYYEIPYPVRPDQFPNCMATISVGLVQEATSELLKRKETQVAD